ncbi:hypothetical protein [Asanoa ishikariensis]|uniref:hypothetical protein n=1 Tax=Asanoa ishikariensis TaxID=137265 RepID=UPI003CC7D6BB
MSTGIRAHGAHQVRARLPLRASAGLRPDFPHQRTAIQLSRTVCTRSWRLTDAEAADVASASFTKLLEERLIGRIYAAAESARQEERRKRQRSLIADIVHAADNWTNTMQELAIGSARRRWETRDIVEWVNSDSGRALVSNMQLIKSNARKLRLETPHPDLLVALDAAQTAVSNPEVFDPIWNGSGSAPEARAVVYRHLNYVKRVFLNLEQIGIKVLAEPQPDGTQP